MHHKVSSTLQIQTYDKKLKQGLSYLSVYLPCESSYKTYSLVLWSSCGMNEEQFQAAVWFVAEYRRRPVNNSS